MTASKLSAELQLCRKHGQGSAGHCQHPAQKERQDVCHSWFGQTYGHPAQSRGASPQEQQCSLCSLHSFTLPGDRAQGKSEQATPALPAITEPSDHVLGLILAMVELLCAQTLPEADRASAVAHCFLLQGVESPSASRQLGQDARGLMD